MPWVITNGHTFITRDQSGQSVTTPNASKATTYKDRKSAAKNALCLPRSLKNLNFNPYFIGLPSTEEASGELKKEETVQAKPAQTKEEAPKEVIRAAAKTSEKGGLDETYLDLDAFIEQTSNFQKFVESAVRQKPILIEGIRRAELEIIDIEHAIEFSHCNVVGGYQWYKMIRDVRERRRKYKDALQCIDILLEECSQLVGKPDISRRYEGLKHRMYTPRALVELADYFKEKEGAAAG